MSIPLATTTLSVLRPSSTQSMYGELPGPPTTIAKSIRAHISSPSGSEIMAAGTEQEKMTFRFNADPCDLVNTDLVKDEKTGKIYKVIWVERRTALGLDYMQGGLQRDTGTMHA